MITIFFHLTCIIHDYYNSFKMCVPFDNRIIKLIIRCIFCFNLSRILFAQKSDYFLILFLARSCPWLDTSVSCLLRIIVWSRLFSEIIDSVLSCWNLSRVRLIIDAFWFFFLWSKSYSFSYITFSSNMIVCSSPRDAYFWNCICG